MLKSLLGHWKAHKRKPSLLPEDGDILHPEDPSRINPIFEDSDGSVISSHRDSDAFNLEAQQSSTTEHRTGIDLALVDISIPVSSEADVSKSADEETPDDVINQIDIAIDSSLRNDEKVNYTEKDVFEPNVKSNEELTNINSNEVETNQTPSTSNADLEFTSKRGQTTDIELDETKLKPVSRTQKEPVHLEPLVESTPKDQKTEVPPDMTPRTEESAIPSTSTGIKNRDKKQTRELNLPTPNLVSEPKMETNIKTRAIDELIKKFQGQKSENDPAIQTISSFLHSPNRKPILKAKTPEQMKNDSEIATSNNGKEKESLSKIFSFPPPPPMEPLKNNKRIEPKDNKETKPSISKSPSDVSNSITQVEGRTRSDSSLSRNKTVSSSDNNHENKVEIKQAEPIKINSSVKDVTSSVPVKLLRSEQSNAPSFTEPVKKTENKTPKETASTSSKIFNKKESLLKKTEQTISKVPEGSDLQATASTSVISKQLPSSNSTSPKQKTEKRTSTRRKSSLTKSSHSPESEIKLTDSKTASEVASPTKDVESPKSNSEDSGITRGDQASSEASPDIPLPNEPQKNGDAVPPAPAKRNLKERRSQKSRSKGCKHCKKSHDDGTSLKRSQCDDYYDVLTGVRRPSRSKHSGSWASDLSWEEKELIRRLRSRRDTIRSNATSIKSRQSNLHHGYFHRHNPIRRSLSEDSILNDSSVCSCDQCYMILVNEHAYGRASLRGIPPNKVFCTCRTSRPDFLGRRVKFRSDPISEGSTSGQASPPPTIPEEPAGKEEATDASNLSTTSQEAGLKNEKSTDKKIKKTKNSKESYRLVTPWELEEWDLAMRRHLLQKRRKRARYMALMALAMVVFVGLVVTVLMIYLRRKVL